MTIKEIIDKKMNEISIDPLCHSSIVPYYYSSNGADTNQGYSDNVKKLKQQIYKSKLEDDFKDVVDIGSMALIIALQQAIRDVRHEMIETGERATMCYYVDCKADKQVKFDYLEALQILYNLISEEYKV